ncbi:MAG: hypothetical protein K8M05_10420 [Deltaproteobacteria bacterium]|nr:hypothetical protein [Kofleriaceae bacterium]
MPPVRSASADALDRAGAARTTACVEAVHDAPLIETAPLRRVGFRQLQATMRRIVLAIASTWSQLEETGRKEWRRE